MHIRLFVIAKDGKAPNEVLTKLVSEQANPEISLTPNTALSLASTKEQR
jgi:hypothetical protein